MTRYFIKVDQDNYITNTLSGDYDTVPEDYLEVSQQLEVCYTWDPVTQTASYVRDDTNGA